MKRLQVLSLLIAVCLVAGFMPISTIADTTHSTLSGVISLPGDDKAPSGGVKVTLNVYTDNMTAADKNDDISFSRTLTIPYGEKSLNYSVMVPKSTNKAARFSVSYTVKNGYAPFGYYSSEGTTAIKAEQTLIKLNESDKSGIDIELLPGKTISGKIVIGNTKTVPSNDMLFTVTAVQEGANAKSTDDDIIISNEVTVEKGKTEAAYVLTVPLNKAGSGYKLYYTYKDGTYNETGYYYKNGTSRSEDKVTLIDVGNTVDGIDLATLPFTNISGAVYLPDNNKAPENGIEVEVKAYNNGSLTNGSDDFYIIRKVNIAKDASSEFYTMTVPVKDTGYIISYAVDKKTGYVTTGYYSVNGTESSKSRASAVDAKEESVSGINLTLLQTLKPIPTPTPAPKPETDDKYDINGDGSIDVYDLLELAKAIVKQYDKPGYWENLKKNRKWPDLNEKDLEVIKESFKPFDNNRYKMKWFDNINQWYKNWNFDWNKNWYDWWNNKEYWEKWQEWWGNKDNWEKWQEWSNDKDNLEKWQEWCKWYDKDSWNAWKDWYNNWYNNKGKNKNENVKKK